MLLAYDDHGPGPVVVLLHGFPLNRTMWAKQLSDVGSMYRIIAPDLRGHGKSAAPDGVYTMDEMADDVIELLDALQLTEPVVLGGLSMGGYVAFSLIARYPERVRGLMLLDTRAKNDSPEAAANREQLAQKVEASHSTEPVIEAMLPKLLGESSREAHPDLAAKVQRMIEKTPTRTIAGTLRGMAIRPDRTPELGKIDVPTLVVVGEQDAITPPDEMRSMADQIPRSRFITIPDAGHLAPMENPGATNDVILEFLSLATNSLAGVGG
ncbi:alpha/beta fold hydrolase [Singulisphaera sp. PoT]|uniref:alpha/beta fold hydrolase n=1 Tax=Singulisphaera sp. PoT TaxID=3411797 RepID=UPI003BF5C73D